MTIVLTGAAGFIGFQTARALLARGAEIIGIDNLNDYYDVRLKAARLAQLKENARFHFHKLDISDKDGVFALFEANPKIDGVIHLAAQAGVRYSLINPLAYIQANVLGHTVMLEAARKLRNIKHFVYASSSSVYGSNESLPFSADDRVDTPNSLYAATKRSDELISYTYAHLYRIPQTGLRFFTVYGPWGRPDMAAYIFATRIIEGKPISVFNYGDMWRDFTFIDDIVSGVLAAFDRPPAQKVPHRIYNLGNHRSEKLMDFIALIEQALDKRAILKFEPIQLGDVPRTYADIEAAKRDLGFEPVTPIQIGVPQFIHWFRKYNQY